MDTSTLIRKMEEYIQTYREQLDRHEGSTLNAVAAGAKRAFESLKAGMESLKDSMENVKDSIQENEKMRGGLEDCREYMEKFENAMKKGDKALSAKTLSLMEAALRALKAKEKGKEDKGHL